MTTNKFLIAEDDAIIRKFLANQLIEYGRVFEADSEQSANEMIEMAEPNMAFVDLNLSNTNKLEGLRIIDKCREKGIIPIVLTAHESKEIYDEAYLRGAHHFFSKGDLISKKDLDHSLLNFIKTFKEVELSQFLKEDFITKDERLISKIKFLKDQVLNYDQKVLISGPSGVGKTKIAEFIHKISGPKTPFISKNLTEISENLFEAELFGYKKGAFTGAVQDKVGLLKLADGGTLFLDEIATLPLKMQQKLLKVIEEKRFTPLGTNQEVTSNFRLITATCENLSEKIQSGDFRIDFYFRIKGAEIEIPALKERTEDIIPLIDFFISKSKKKISFSKESLTLLKDYNWYGNVRELASTIKELMSCPIGLINKDDLPKHIRDNTNPFREKNIYDNQRILNIRMKDYINKNGLPSLLKEIEKEALQDAICKFGHKINVLSRHLKISKSVFYRINQEINNESS